jgi:hypothetical protein
LPDCTAVHRSPRVLSPECCIPNRLTWPSAASNGKACSRSSLYPPLGRRGRLRFSQPAPSSCCAFFIRTIAAAGRLTRPYVLPALLPSKQQPHWTQRFPFRETSRQPKSQEFLGSRTVPCLVRDAGQRKKNNNCRAFIAMSSADYLLRVLGFPHRCSIAMQLAVP